MKTSVQKLQKKCRREHHHELWLRKNLINSKQHCECRKRIFKLHTEISFGKKKNDQNPIIDGRKELIELCTKRIPDRMCRVLGE